MWRGVHEVGDPLEEPGPIEQRVGFQHVTDLGPGGVDEALLVEPDDLGAEAGGSPVPWIGVQLAKPDVVGGREGRLAHCRPAVDGRGDRLGVGRGALEHVLGGGVEQLDQGVDEPGVLRAEGGPGAGVGGAQGTFEVDDAAGAGFEMRERGIGVADEHRPAPDGVGHGAGDELAGQRLEVAGGTGAELPVEVGRQGDGGGDSA